MFTNGSSATGASPSFCNGGSGQQQCPAGISSGRDEFDNNIAQVLLSNGFRGLPGRLPSIENLFLAERGSMAAAGDTGYSQQGANSQFRSQLSSSLNNHQHQQMQALQEQIQGAILEQQRVLHSREDLLQAGGTQLNRSSISNHNEDSEEGQDEIEKPKRSLSAYNFYFQSQRKFLLKTLPARNGKKPRKSHGKIGFADMARTIAAKWKQISPEEKTKYVELAKMDTVRYKREMALYHRMKEEVAFQKRTMDSTGGDRLDSQQDQYGASPDAQLNINHGAHAQLRPQLDQPRQLTGSLRESTGSRLHQASPFLVQAYDQHTVHNGNVALLMQQSQLNQECLRRNSLLSLARMTSQNSLGMGHFHSVELPEDRSNDTFLP